MSQRFGFTEQTSIGQRDLLLVKEEEYSRGTEEGLLFPFQHFEQLVGCSNRDYHIH